MWICLFLIANWILSSVIAESAILDARCYLEGGGSAENLIAGEDLKLGSELGKLRINGDPSVDGGDIKLSVREKDAPVSIAPGTKTLVLTAALDKEGVKGHSSIYVNIICDRRHSNDPSFIIPVNVRVTDVNDNAPEWIGAPYTLTLSEVTVPGTRILQGAKAVDYDQEGPFSTVEYRVLPGPFAEYVSFVSPLEGTIVLRKPLDYELVKNFTIQLRAQDHGTPPKSSDTTLRVIVTDADDQNPKFIRESYFAEVFPETGLGELKIQPEALRAVDQDEGLRAPLEYAIMPSTEARYFSINHRTGAINLVALPPNSVVTMTLVIRATQINNADRYALVTLAVHNKKYIAAEKSLTFIQPKFHASVREDIPLGSRIIGLPTHPPGKHLFYTLLPRRETTFFGVGSFGEVILKKALDYENQTKHEFRVFASDGVSNATTDVIVDVIDVNEWEPRFRYNSYDFVIPKNSDATGDGPVALGQLEAADGDTNDRIDLSIRGFYAHLFEADSKGMLWLRGERPNETTVHLIVTATDTGSPPRSKSVPVKITMNGLVAAKAQWATGVLETFGVVLALFTIVITCLIVYIYRSRKSAGACNRVHSNGNSGLDDATKAMGNNKMLHKDNNAVLGRPINRYVGGSDSSISAGASTILAATLEREAQQKRDHNNYSSGVQNIISRSSLAYDNDKDLDQDSIMNADMDKTKWSCSREQIFRNSQQGPFWGNNRRLNNEKNESTDLAGNMGSTENNLTVYF